MDEEFHSYFRYLTPEEWTDYWTADHPRRYERLGEKVVDTSPLGNYVEVNFGSANFDVCLSRSIDDIDRAAEAIRVEYFIAMTLWDRLVLELENSNSAIQQVIDIQKVTYLYHYHNQISKAQELVQVVLAKKACLAALKEI